MDWSVVLSEICFPILNDRLAIPHAKPTDTIVTQRMQLQFRYRNSVVEDEGAARPSECQPDNMLYAFAAMRSAERVLAGRQRSTCPKTSSATKSRCSKEHVARQPPPPSPWQRGEKPPRAAVDAPRPSKTQSWCPQRASPTLGARLRRVQGYTNAGVRPNLRYSFEWSAEPLTLAARLSCSWWRPDTTCTRSTDSHTIQKVAPMLELPPECRRHPLQPVSVLSKWDVRIVVDLR